MLVTLKDILEKASREGYGVVITRCNHSGEVRAALGAAEAKKSPIVLELRPDPIDIRNRADYAVWLRKCCESASVPVALSAEPEGTEEAVKAALDLGVTSISIHEGPRRQPLSAEQVRTLTEMVHAAGCSCAGMLGDKEHPVEPDMAAAFVKETGIDCLAAELVIRDKAGSHVDLPRLIAVREALGTSCPIILHGGFGLTNVQYGEACSSGAAALNISKDLWKAGRDRVQAENWDPFCSSVMAIEEALKELISAAGGENRA
ncbi:MAG: class II fructose-bisphosphate aldolase [Oscillospiraceae bacterium]|nr:class II fructose-bisphosphate aldolase [Oscillospiraceae bacterium]